jgi:hypothetical protein
LWILHVALIEVNLRHQISARQANPKQIQLGPRKLHGPTPTVSIGKGHHKPCLNALRLDFNRPAAVLGPVLSLALARLAAIVLVGLHFSRGHLAKRFRFQIVFANFKT